MVELSDSGYGDGGYCQRRLGVCEVLAADTAVAAAVAAGSIVDVVHVIAALFFATVVVGDAAIDVVIAEKGRRDRGQGVGPCPKHLRRCPPRVVVKPARS